MLEQQMTQVYRQAPRAAATDCARCGRPLKDPVSIARGLGPVCAGTASRSDSGKLLQDAPVLNGVGTLQDVGLICRRLEGGRAAANVPHVIVHHSPDGFEWGYSGSGPAELALNVLHALMPVRPTRPDQMVGWQQLGGVQVSSDACLLYQDFKAEFIAPMSVHGGHVPIEVINEWIAKRLLEAA